MKRVLVIGSGAREHALAWKLSQSPRVEQVYVAPGNGGTSRDAINIDVDIKDNQALLKIAKKHRIDLTVVGPDNVLARGLVDVFNQAGLKVFGPTKFAAQIESSKAFSKNIMQSLRVPTARFKVFTTLASAEAYLDRQSLPVVIKASGLALGKGVYICFSKQDTTLALQELFIEKRFGASAGEVIIEDYLDGHEVSVHAFSDGSTSALFPVSQDYKQISEGDKGPNTGGMGVVAPVEGFSNELMHDIKQTAVQPIIDKFTTLEQSYVGCLYPGLLFTKNGYKVLEYNARFGDPETQVYTRLLDTDLFDILSACVDGTLGKTKIRWKQNRFAVCVVLAADGYPGKARSGDEITGIEKAEEDTDVAIFHAGTRLSDDKLITNGGRVLSVTAIADSQQEALDKVYKAVKKIYFKGMHFRRDIGSNSAKLTIN